ERGQRDDANARARRRGESRGRRRRPGGGGAGALPGERPPVGGVAPAVVRVAAGDDAADESCLVPQALLAPGERREPRVGRLRRAPRLGGDDRPEDEEGEKRGGERAQP